MTVALNPDPARRRVVVVVPPSTRWVRFHETVREAVSNNSAWASWDWIIDDRGPMDDVDVPEMVATGALFSSLCGTPPRQSYTVVVTLDRFFWQWASVINRHYAGRKHFSAPTLDDAHVMLNCFAAAARAKQ